MERRNQYMYDRRSKHRLQRKDSMVRRPSTFTGSTMNFNMGQQHMGQQQGGNHRVFAQDDMCTWHTQIAVRNIVDCAQDERSMRLVGGLPARKHVLASGRNFSEPKSPTKNLDNLPFDSQHSLDYHSHTTTLPQLQIWASPISSPTQA